MTPIGPMELLLRRAGVPGAAVSRTVRRGRPQALYIECWRCGFEPADQRALPVHRCPKCHSWTWHRLVRPRSLLGAT